MSTNIISNTEALTLGQLMGVLKSEHDQGTANDLIRKYCLQSSSIDVQKKGMEFLYMNGYYDDLTLLIEKNLNSEDPTVQNWAEIYQNFHPFQQYQPSPLEIFNKIQAIETNEPELICLIEFAKAHVHHKMSYYNKIGDILVNLEDVVLSMEDPLFLNYMKERLNQVALIYTFSRNEIIIARKFAYKLITTSKNPLFLIDVHLKLGFSYLFESYIKGIYHLKEALSIAKSWNLENDVHYMEQKIIPFYCAHFGKAENITSTIESEQAHIEIAKGNNKQAIKILERLPLESPFELYYLGKAKKDKKILLQAHNKFVEKHSNYFFARLPLNELKKL